MDKRSGTALPLDLARGYAVEGAEGHINVLACAVLRAAEEIDRLERKLYEAKMPPAWRGDWGHVDS